MLAVTLSIPGEWLVVLTIVAPFLVYVIARRDRQSSTLTKSEVLTDKTVDNIKDLWEKRDDLKSDMSDLSERLSYLEGAHAAKGCFQPRPPAK